MIRISKILFINPAQIWISGIECCYDNIIKITDIFDFKYIVLGIDSLAEDSSLLKFLKEEDLKYCIIKKDSAYFEMLVEVPYNLFKCILRKVVDEDPENIFVLNLFDHANWVDLLHRSFEGLVAKGIANLFISIGRDERGILVSFNKDLLFCREAYKKIRALQFE